VELHGDRSFADDPALMGGPARLNGEVVMVLGHQKGRDIRENVARNFGQPHPEGYRKALRLMRQAERFGMPLLCFLDTAAASGRLEDEERGQAWALGDNLVAMAGLRVPIVVVVLGEGGSGGALAIGVGDRILMLEHAIYSVASPEACASIVWKDARFAPQAAEALKLTARDLYRLGIVDRVLPEPLGGAHRDHAATARIIQEAVTAELAACRRLSIEKLLAARYAKYRRIGEWREGQAAQLAAAAAPDAS